jgi:predicted transcriptional regulator
MATKRSPELPILTRAESELMALFWARGAMTVAALHALSPERAYTSLATLVKILEQKGYLTHSQQADARAFVFAPAVAQPKARQHHVKDLIDRLFGGRREDLVAGLLADEKFTRDELEALRADIDARLGRGKK